MNGCSENLQGPILFPNVILERSEESHLARGETPWPEPTTKRGFVKRRRKHGLRTSKARRLGTERDYNPRLLCSIILCPVGSSGAKERALPQPFHKEMTPAMNLPFLGPNRSFLKSSKWFVFLLTLAFALGGPSFGEETMSNDATLKSLSLSEAEVSPGFSSGRNAYTVHVPHSLQSVSVQAVPNQAGATVSVRSGSPIAEVSVGPVEIEVGRNIVDVEVTAPDGKTTNTYTVKVIRAHPTPNWVRVAEKTPFIPRDSAGETVFGNKMWLFGGYTPPLLNDVWCSPDGTSWEKAGTIPDESGVNIPINLVYRDRMWVTANDGSFWSSEDGVEWVLATDDAPWKGRYGAAGVVFEDKMWVMGGRKGNAIFNDVWSSTDGVRWNLETETAPWSKRQLFSTLAVHDRKMWAIGGGISVYHPFRAYRDVWNSPDGRNWTKVTDEAPWPARIWNSSLVYKNRLWLFGGFRAEPTWNNFEDVWYSADGRDWGELKTEDIWTPRHEISTYVFDDKLWVVAGNAWPLMNDVWYLEIPGLVFLSQPIIEDFVTARYSYRAHADFNASGQPVRYRFLESPDWLDIDSDTGLVRGTPEEVGDFQIAIEAYDEAGEKARQSYTLHVIPLG